MAFGEGEIVIPGQRLGTTEQFEAGSAARDLHTIWKDLCKHCRKDLKAEYRFRITKAPAENVPSLTPNIGQVVTCKVTTITPPLARAKILCIGSQELCTSFTGIIRVQDVREMEKDKVTIYDSFRPGDIVLAKVISLGDAKSYYLSTAENVLGVVAAKSAAGGQLVPASWCEMTCSVTGVQEPRKVAQPVLLGADDESSK